MKELFAQELVLLIPDPTKLFALATDASKHASGGLLMQKDINGDWHPCGYISQSFSDAERNYQIYDRELLAIIRVLLAWKHLLMGSPHKVIVCTDHKNLTYFRSPKHLDPRQARWQLFLSQFDLGLVHVPGSRMKLADALSRRADHIPDG